MLRLMINIIHNTFNLQKNPLTFYCLQKLKKKKRRDPHPIHDMNVRQLIYNNSSKIIIINEWTNNKYCADCWRCCEVKSNCKNYLIMFCWSLPIRMRIENECRVFNLCLDLFHVFSLTTHLRWWFFFSLSDWRWFVIRVRCCFNGVGVCFVIPGIIIIYKILLTDKFWMILFGCVWDLSIIMMASQLIV